MDDQITQAQMNELNRKLDVIIEEIELQRRHRREMEDLKDDLMRVGKDLYQTAVVELEEVHDSLNSGDIVYLGKKLLRSVNTITRSIEQLENARDFAQDFSPVAREMFIDLMGTLDEMDRKGYFTFLREFAGVMDQIVSSFSAEDVRHLGENVVTILNTVKSLTQPEILHAINNALQVYKKLDVQNVEEASLFSLLKELNTPEARRGLAFTMKFLKTVASQESSKEVPQINH
jgi:uncharacterized protein YjgD (DUF1641 family)